MSVIEKLDEVAGLIAEGHWTGSGHAWRLIRDHGPAIRQALLKAELWDKHAGSFETLEAMLEIASPLILNKLKAKDAAIDARLASDSEGGNQNG